MRPYTPVQSQRAFGLALLLLSGLLLAAPGAQAAEVYLVAKAFDKTLPDGAVVPMWGFAVDADSDLNTDGDELASSPGPVLSVPAADAGLTIHLRNDLAVPVSVHIPGQQTGDGPVMFTDGQGRQRVRSFVHETAPGAISSYSYPALRPGTYLYQSGTHPAVQVQMGLVGAVVKDSAAGLAYPGVAYDHELILVYSEIDPALHAAVDDGTYGTPAYPSTIDYRPTYFLVNGQPFDPADVPLDAGAVGQAVLLRFVNAGLMTHAPMLHGKWVEVLAEDGNPYAFPRPQYTLMLGAGQTRDALLSPAAAGEIPVWDRRLYLTSAGVGGGGMLVKLAVAQALVQTHDGPAPLQPADRLEPGRLEPPEVSPAGRVLEPATRALEQAPAVRTQNRTVRELNPDG